MVTLAHWRRRVNGGMLDNQVMRQFLSPGVIEKHCRQVGHVWRASFWSPAMTLHAFLIQVLDGAKTVRSAVAQLQAQLIGSGRVDLPSGDPSAYCQARRRLPGAMIQRLLAQSTDRLRHSVAGERGWLGRQVWVLDGSSVSMPDAPELQQAFPQPPGQQPGCGFPVAQFVALFCWTTGAVIDLATDTIKPHELKLFRRLWHHFAAGDVVLADRAYCSYVDLARLLEKGVFSVFRLHQRRVANFRQGIRLGPDDRLVVWQRPKRWLPSVGISREAFEALPESMTVRLVRIIGAVRGFRSRTLVVATTLLDPIEVAADDIRALYRDRWTVELNLRSLKVALGMDVLRGQSVDVVCKEIAMHLLAYNLIRTIMWQAARHHGRDLHRMSFTGTLHRLRAFLPVWRVISSSTRRQRLTDKLLSEIARHTLPHRPNRIEPRRRKRRPKPYSLLVKPRSWYHHHVDTGAR